MKAPSTIIFGWVMDYPGKEGFFPEIVDREGITLEELPKAPSREAGVKKLKAWADKNPETTLILMKEGRTL
jgi:hypothetical protein